MSKPQQKDMKPKENDELVKVPIDNNLKLETKGDVENKSINLRSILYIDSSDAESINNTKNLTLDKRSRMISVKCEYED